MSILRRPQPPSWADAVSLLLGSPAVAAERPSEFAVAAAVNVAFSGTSGGKGHASPVDDAAFLRRASLDPTGKVPDPDTLRKFVADPTADKRVRVVDELLKTDAYATNWGRYWRDAITYHTPASANYLRWKEFDKW